MANTFSGRLNIDVSGCSFKKIQRTKENIPTENCMYWRLYWNPQGGEDLFYRGQCHRTIPDQITIISPQAEVSRFPTPEPFEHFYIHFTLGMPWDMLTDKFFQVPMTPVMKSLAEECILDNNPHKLKIFSICALISECLSSIELTESQIPVLDKRIENTIDFINSNPAKKMDNDTLAQKNSMSRNAFARLFKQQTSLSPQLFIRGKRLDRCSQLLINTDKSLEEIAEICGFCDRHYLTRLFARKNKISPAAFRHRNRPRESVK